ncbi:MAG: hypothetical protein GVY12_01250 [Bacteroidetes bacterium]|jgi:hypothetical protein|nr:hypothetical protein [Bacteroidota bacterium]
MNLSQKIESPALSALTVGLLMIPISLGVNLALPELGGGQALSPGRVLMLVGMFASWAYVTHRNAPAVSNRVRPVVAMGLCAVIHLLGFIPTRLLVDLDVWALITVPVGALCAGLMVFLSTLLRSW